MSNIMRVSTLDGLYDALSQATGGEVIKLAPGNYGDLSLSVKTKFNYQFASNVTIISEDPANPAKFETVDIRDGANMTFDSILFDYTFQEGQPIWNRPFDFGGGENITIRNSTFDGDVARNVSASEDGLGYGIALSIGSSKGSVIENNEIFGFNRGIGMGKSEDGIVRGNEVYHIRTDGMNFSQMKGILIEDNYIHDFKRSDLKADHSDMIQFWTNNTTEPSTDIIIRGNRLDIGDSNSTQSIFMRNDQVDRGLAGEEMFYQNVLIEDNIITNGHVHGITLGEADGVVIRNNSVLHSDGGNVDGADRSSEIPRIAVASSSKDVVISDNVTSRVGGERGQSDWTVSNNVFVQDQDPLGAGYYSDMFVASSLTADDGVHRFVALPDGEIAQLGAGAPELHHYDRADSLTAQFHVRASEDSASVREFDARLTVGNFDTLPAGTSFEWTIDGQSISGSVVSYAFPTGGIYDVQLKVTTPDGSYDYQNTKVGIIGPQVVSMASDGALEVHGPTDTKQLADNGNSDALALGSGVVATVDRKYLDGMFGTDDVAFSMQLKSDRIGAEGEIFRIHNSTIVSIEDGDLVVKLFPEGASMVTLTSQGVNLSNSKPHDVTVHMKDGRVEIEVDGVVRGATDMPGHLRNTSDHDLRFGSNSQESFAGTLSDFSITANGDDFTGAQQPIVVSDQSYQDIIVVEAPPPAETDTAAADTGSGTSTSNPVPPPQPAVEAPAVIQVLDEAAVFHSFDGPSNLGRQQDVEGSDRLGVTLEFQSDEPQEADARLVWNHLRLGVELVDDGLRIRVATADNGFKSIDLKNLGLDDTEAHKVSVLTDSGDDRIQVIVDDKVALDRQDLDLDIVEARDREWGWKVGSAWGHAYEGTVNEVQIGDRFEFLEDEDGLFL